MKDYFVSEQLLILEKHSCNLDLVKVIFDWTMDLFFKPDVAMIKRITEIRESTKIHLTYLDKDSSMLVDSQVRVLGISTTNSNEDVAPRKSTSEGALNFALDYAKKKLGAECIMIKLRQLNFKHCKGYYS